MDVIVLWVLRLPNIPGEKKAKTPQVEVKSCDIRPSGQMGRRDLTLCRASPRRATASRLDAVTIYSDKSADIVAQSGCLSGEIIGPFKRHQDSQSEWRTTQEVPGKNPAPRCFLSMGSRFIQLLS